jgi:hypothetical protein
MSSLACISTNLYTRKYTRFQEVSEETELILPSRTKICIWFHIRHRRTSFSQEEDPSCNIINKMGLSLCFIAQAFDLP